MVGRDLEPGEILSARDRLCPNVSILDTGRVLKVIGRE
jgi:hypothetical protein